jgi:hypothetical protein
MASIPIDALVKLVRRKKVHQLGENRLAEVHPPSPFAVLRKYGCSKVLNSNRKIPF